MSDNEEHPAHEEQRNTTEELRALENSYHLTQENATLMILRKIAMNLGKGDIENVNITKSTV